MNRYKLHEPRMVGLNFNPFRIGDRVIVRDQYTLPHLEGAKGTVVELPDYDKVFVNWDHINRTKMEMQNKDIMRVG